MKLPVQLSEDEDKAIYKWRTCIHSGWSLKLVVTDSEKHEFVTRGYCSQKGEDLDIYPNCLYCDRRMTTASDEQVKRATAQGKSRGISQGRQRQLARKEKAKNFIIKKAIDEYNKKN